jgi:hypothetical protein
MKRHATATTAALAILLVAAVTPAVAQTAFKIPFPFQAGGKKLPAGEYAVLKTAEGPLTLRQEATGKEFPVPVTERLAQPTPALAEPQIVFDEVGDFAPSYTEYITVYILSEVWFPRQDGFRTHTTKGAHKTRVVKAAGTK